MQTFFMVKGFKPNNNFAEPKANELNGNQKLNEKTKSDFDNILKNKIDEDSISKKQSKIKNDNEQNITKDQNQIKDQSQIKDQKNTKKSTEKTEHTDHNDNEKKLNNDDKEVKKENNKTENESKTVNKSEIVDNDKEKKLNITKQQITKEINNNESDQDSKNIIKNAKEIIVSLENLEKYSKELNIDKKEIKHHINELKNFLKNNKTINKHSAAKYEKLTNNIKKWLETIPVSKNLLSKDLNLKNLLNKLSFEIKTGQLYSQNLKNGSVNFTINKEATHKGEFNKLDNDNQVKESNTENKVSKNLKVKKSHHAPNNQNVNNTNTVQKQESENAQVMKTDVPNEVNQSDNFQYAMKDTKNTGTLSNIKHNINVPKGVSPQMAETIYNQVVEKVKIKLAKNVNEISLKLKPEQFGKMKLTVSMNDGNVVGKIVVENYAVKKIIEANLENFSEQLKDSGMNLSELEVSVGQDQSDFELGDNKQNGLNDLGIKTSLDSSYDLEGLDNAVVNTESYLIPEHLASNVNLSI